MNLNLHTIFVPCWCEAFSKENEEDEEEEEKQFKLEKKNFMILYVVFSQREISFQCEEASKLQCVYTHIAIIEGKK